MPTSWKGIYSSTLCHLANMSYRLGEEVPFNPQTKAFGDNREAYETLAGWRNIWRRPIRFRWKG